MRSSTAPLVLRRPRHGAAPFGSRQTCIHPFPDHAALELGKHLKPLKHGPAGRGAGVESLLVQVKVATRLPVKQYLT
jgi:hypothetical protein